MYVKADTRYIYFSLDMRLIHVVALFLKSLSKNTKLNINYPS